MSRDAQACDSHRLAAAIVHFGTPGPTAACVAALHRSRRPVDHLVVVDNGSGDQALRDSVAACGARRLGQRRAWRTIAGGHGEAEREGASVASGCGGEGAGPEVPEGGSERGGGRCGGPKGRANPPRVPISEQLDWIEAPRNLGFAGGANLAVRRALDAGASRVLLLNSDALLDPDCLGILESAVEQPGVGLAGPAIVSASDPATLESTGIAYSPLTGRMRLSGWGMPVPAADSPAHPVDALSGCALMIRREVFDRVGLLPEEYFFGFEDLDFCLRARSAGFLALCAPAARVLHQGGASLAPGSPDRIYFATRNHLMLARRARPLPAPLSALRAAHILALNLAHLALRSRVPRLAGARALASGFADYCTGRFGARITASSAEASAESKRTCEQSCATRSSADERKRCHSSGSQ